jgi:SAM-dependent methyltransferase
MNKQAISKLNLFLMGIKSRFEENYNIFKSINISYKTGLKTFNGIGELDSQKLKFNFNGITSLLSFDELITLICNECNNYNSLSLTYKERGTDILIEADNKNVKMKSSEDMAQEKEKLNSINETSTLLNRNYYIKVGEADILLKEIGIMTLEGKIKNDKIRKYNQIDHYVELFDDIITKVNRGKILTILDCGCGKSYLSFVLNYYFTEIKKMKCHFIGIDYKESVIESSRKMAKNLGYRNMEFHAMDIKNYNPNSSVDIVMSLHACDTATDMALALGIRLQSEAIVAVPCCHREMLSQYSYEPFKDIIKYGVLKSRMADILTDGMRALMLESKGYDVSIVEYISPLETPKNLMIRAIRNNTENEDAMSKYLNLMSNLNSYPALYDLVNNW